MTIKEALENNISVMNDTLNRLNDELEDLLLAEDADYADVISMTNAMCHVSTKITEACKERTFAEISDRRSGKEQSK